MKKDRKYKVRFHLATGKNFMKWQIRELVKGEKDIVAFHDPNKVSLRLKNCKLHNQSNTANKIYEGANKTVCAWIECDSVEIEQATTSENTRVSYNPRVSPHWIINEKNVDNIEVNEIISSNKSLYLV